MPIITSFRKLRKEDGEFRVCLDYIERGREEKRERQKQRQVKDKPMFGTNSFAYQVCTKLKSTNVLNRGM
jgi:hypothetical protein